MKNGLFVSMTTLLLTAFSSLSLAAVGTSSGSGGNFARPTTRLSANQSAEVSSILGLNGPGKVQAKISCQRPALTASPQDPRRLTPRCGGVVVVTHGRDRIADKGQFDVESSRTLLDVASILPGFMSPQGQRGVRFEVTCEARDISTRTSVALLWSCVLQP